MCSRSSASNCSFKSRKFLYAFIISGESNRTPFSTLFLRTSRAPSRSSPIEYRRAADSRRSSLSARIFPSFTPFGSIYKRHTAAAVRTAPQYPSGTSARRRLYYIMRVYY